MRSFILFQASLFLAALLIPNSATRSVQSPIAFQSTPCATYNNLQISMHDIKDVVPQEDAHRGSFIVHYDGAKFQINNDSYTSRLITFKSDSEHSLPNGKSALEMQIEMDNDEQGKPPAVLSFLVEDIGEDPTDIRKLEHYRVYNQSKIIESLNPEGWTLNLKQLGQKLMAKEAAAQFLGMYRYPGTLTHSPSEEATWYVHGTPLFAPTSTIYAFRNHLQTATQFTPGDNARPIIAAETSSPSVDNLCYAGYFEVTLGQDYGLWFGIVIIVFFFIFTLWLSERPVTARHFQENPWTHHPIYSVYSYGNELHTRKSRATLILVMMTLNACFSALWYSRSHNPTRSTNIILYAVYSSLISFFTVFFIGNVLRWYYVAKSEYHQTKDEAWDQRAQNRLFGFYILIFITVVVGWPVAVWRLNGSPSDVQTLWIASFFIGLALELIVYYPIECLMAKSLAFRSLAKRRGFLYDTICHETYLAYNKSL